MSVRVYVFEFCKYGHKILNELERAAITKSQRVGSLKQRWILSQFWRLEVQDQGVDSGWLLLSGLQIACLHDLSPACVSDLLFLSAKYTDEIAVHLNGLILR